MSKIEKVAVVGLGYVGLPTLIAIAKTNLYEVVGFDVNEDKIKALINGENPIEDEEVGKFLKLPNISFTSNLEKIRDCQVYIIAVPTPVMDDYLPDYSLVIKASQSIAPYLKKGDHFVLESTVNPGTCEEIIIPEIKQLSKLKAGVDFNIAHCPERINPGDPKWNVYNINRNIGSLTKTANQEIAAFYRSYITNALVNEVSNIRIAEATKIVENTFRDVNIAYVNELAQSFDAMGIDLKETIDAASNKQFAFMAHYPGAGVGGHCIAVDPYYLIKRASLSGFDHRFLKMAREVNNSMPEYAVNRLIIGLNEIGLAIKDTSISLLGLAYKANLSDLRESPALEIKKILTDMQANLTCYDPYVKCSNFHIASNLQTALKNATALLIATAHQEIVDNLSKLLPKYPNVKVIVDGRNCLNKEEIIGLGIIYKGIGR